MKQIVTTFAVFFISIIAYTQLHKELSLGDKIPTIILNRIWGNEKAEISTADFHGKLTILDFWNITCKDCIFKMPYMDSLQEEFGDKIKVVGVTADSIRKIDQVFEKIKRQRPKFPIITADTILNQLFPHISVPFHVWIDAKGIIVALTHGFCTTRSSIQSALANVPVNLPRQIPGQYKRDYRFLSEQNHTLLSLAKSYSLLMYTKDYINGGSIKVEPNLNSDSANFIAVVNARISRLYMIAYGKELYGFHVDLDNIVGKERISVEVADSLLFFLPGSEEYANWVANSTYSYEVSIQPGRKINAYAVMQRDLNNYFDYKVSIEKRVRPCIVLRRTSNANRFVTLGAVKPRHIIKSDTLILENRSMKDVFARFMDSYYKYKPQYFIDQTGYDGNVSISLFGSLEDLTSVNSQLKSYDLEMVEKEEEIDVLVIRDK